MENLGSFKIPDHDINLINALRERDVGELQSFSCVCAVLGGESIASAAASCGITDQDVIDEVACYAVLLAMLSGERHDAIISRSGITDSNQIAEIKLEVAKIAFNAGSSVSTIITKYGIDNQVHIAVLMDMALQKARIA